jgi:hypothetical protein
MTCKEGTLQSGRPHSISRPHLYGRLFRPVQYLLTMPLAMLLALARRHCGSHPTFSLGKHSFSGYTVAKLSMYLRDRVGRACLCLYLVDTQPVAFHLRRLYDSRNV